MKLYDISEQYREVQKLLESDDSESMQEAVADTMEMIEGDFEEKANNVVSLTLNMGADVDAIDSEIKRLQEKKKVVQNKIESIRSYLKTNMEATGINKISCPLFSITLSKASKKVEITDENLIPDECVNVKTTITPDKTQIAKLLKDGSDVPGAVLVDSERRLIIK